MVRTGRRKLDRPVSTRRPMHVVLMSPVSESASTTLPTWARISTCSCGRAGGMHFRDFCDRLRGSWGDE